MEADGKQYCMPCWIDSGNWERDGYKTDKYVEGIKHEMALRARHVCRGCRVEVVESEASRHHETMGWYCQRCWEERHIYCDKAEKWYSLHQYIRMLAEQIEGLQIELREAKEKKEKNG
jgi:uncharacterized protein YbaR (Trm112 family)